MSCLAGGGSMLIHRPRTGTSVALDFNVAAPRGARAGMYRLGAGQGGDLFPWRAVEGDANVHGALAVAVPGSVAGLALALERWGTLDLRDAVAPAARLARRGVPIDWYLAGVTAMYAEELSRFPEAARTYLREGRWAPRPANLEGGDRVRYPALARSLELIGKEGPSVFYRGSIAEAIEAEIRRGGGVLDRADLARIPRPGGGAPRGELPRGDAARDAGRHGLGDRARGDERPRMLRRGRRRAVRAAGGASSRGGHSRRLRGPAPLAGRPRHGPGAVGGPRREGLCAGRGRRHPARRPSPRAPARWTRGASRAGPRGAPAPRRWRRAGRPTSAPRTSARSTVTGRWCRSRTPRSASSDRRSWCRRRACSWATGWSGSTRSPAGPIPSSPASGPWST